MSEENILEKFINAKGVAVFILNKTETLCAENKHLHFKCNECQTVTLLPQLPTEYMSALGNSPIKSLNLMIEGTCGDCSLKEI